jgi:rhombotail lipoprotein
VLKSILVALSILAASCEGMESHYRSNSLEYLYPAGSPATPPQDVQIRVPARVGIAFAPTKAAHEDPFSETQKQALLGRIAEKFKDRKGIAPIEVIPSSQLTPLGGFAELDRIRLAFGVDLVMLVSFDQLQSSESTSSSWTYWTIVGAYVVPGERNQTRTVVDAVVFDVGSRAMLLHASGSDSTKDSSTPAAQAKNLRDASEKGFTRAVDDLMAKLDTALDGFVAQAATGTVHGPGTPAVAMVDKEGKPLPPGGSGGASGAGASGLAELGAALLLLFSSSRAYRSRPA